MQNIFNRFSFRSLTTKIGQSVRKTVSEAEQEGIACNTLSQFPLRTLTETVVRGPKPNKWTQAIEIYNDGNNICIWGYHGSDTQRTLASRWINDRTEDDWYIEPHFVISDYLVNLESRLFTLAKIGKISKDQHRELLSNIEIARTEFHTRCLGQSLESLR